MKLLMLLFAFVEITVISLELVTTTYEDNKTNHSEACAYPQLNRNYAKMRKFKRQASKCGSTVELLDCDVNQPLSFSPTETNKIKAKYVVGTNCNIKRNSFQWTVLLSNGTNLDFDDYYNKETFMIEPYTVGGGDHHIVVYITEYDEDDNSYTISSDACQFNIRVELPVPKISGGLRLMVSSDEDYEVSGKHSIDLGVPVDKPGKLLYKWSCSVEGTKGAEFCQRDLGTAVSVVIPKKYALDGAYYTFNLSVRTPVTDWKTAQQRIRFKKDAVAIELKCVKNCFPAVLKTNSKESTIIEAICLKNCQKVKPETYEWTINDPSFDYKSNTKHGRNSNIFYIMENVLAAGKLYKIGLFVKELFGGAAINIEVHEPPKLNSCSVNPKKGEALKTKFVVDCSYKEGNYMFEVYSLKDNLEVLLDRGIKLKYLDFLLSPGAKVKVKIIDDYRFSDSKILDVDVTPSLVNTNTKEELDKEVQNKYFKDSKNSLINLINLGKFDEALQAATSLADELGNIKKNDETANVIKKYQVQLLEHLEKVPLASAARARQLSGIVTKIADGHMTKPDPEIAALATNICVKSAKEERGRVKAKRFPQSFSEEIKDSTKTLSKCSQASNTPNLEIMQAPDTPVVTTPFPLLDIPVITEDYPDYVDDQNISKFRKNFEVSSNNLINICYINSETLEITMVPQEDTKAIGSETFNVVVMKQFGSQIADSKIESQGVKLVASNDFVHYNSEIHVSMCTSTKNPFWWIQKEEIFTSVAIIQFKVDEQSINTFKQPFLVSFEIHNSSLVETHEGRTPRNPNGTMSQAEYDFEKISMHRIDVYAEEGFIVEFHSLSESDLLDEPLIIGYMEVYQYLDELENHAKITTTVVEDFEDIKQYLNNLYKPTLEEFQELATQVTKENNTIFCPHHRNYDSWYYLAVLPNKKLGSRSIDYKFSVYTSSCYHWVPEIRSWQFACGPAKTSSAKRIECECYHSSTFSGRVNNNRIREEQTLYMELELEVQACWIIFISVAIVFTLYCFLLTYFSVRRKIKFVGEDIYFLGDVPSYYRYGYLIVVKTGNKANAGTTSNVVIKLYGNKSESKEHVLNYPDPEKRFLRRNQEDWFFMATELHLGDIEKIDIWFDCIGYRPKWYCSEIEVFDVQENNYWLFKINKWFETLPKEQVFYTALPITKKGKLSKRKYLFKNFSNAFGGPHMWNLKTYEEETFSTIKRLTIILSIFMTTYLLGLLLYGCPRLENSDSLAYTLEYGPHIHVILITIACFVLTFAIHFPIVWLFRYSKKNRASDSGNDVRRLIKDIHLLCWYTLVFIVTVSMTLLIIFGFWVPHITGLLWLTSVIASLLVYIFLLENIVRIITNLKVKQKTRADYILEQVKLLIIYVEQQRSMLYKKFGKAVLRPFLTHLYEPMDITKIKAQQNSATTKEKIYEIVEDLVMVTIYVLLLYLVIIMDKDPEAYVSHVEVQELIQGIHSRSIEIEDINTRNEFQEYVLDSLIFSMQSPQWYGKFITENAGMTIDNANKYIGIARLRQHRTSNDSCKVPTSMHFLTDKCRPKYSSKAERRHFSEAWRSDKYSDKFARMDDVWKYTQSLKAGTLAYVGKFGYYPGGGYLAGLGRTLKNSIINANYLFRNGWIDSLSRCIFIEFILYNVNSNLFNSVNIKFEISPTGYIRRKFNVHTAKLLFVKEEMSLMILIIFISFMVIAAMFAIKVVYRVTRKKRLILKDVWYVVDMVIIVINVACIFLYRKRSGLVKVFLSKIEKAMHNEFVNYFHLMYAETTLTVLAAILVFISTLRLWKLLRFLLIIRIVEKTLLLIAAPFLCLLLFQTVLLLCFTFTGIILFGDQSFDFKSIPDTLVTLVLLCLNFYPDIDLGMVNTPIGYCYYSLYMILSLVLCTVYVTVITICYGEAQVYYSNEQQDYNVQDYIKEQYEYYSELSKIKWKNSRLRAGDEEAEENKGVYPKADEHRYADCLTIPLNKIRAMGFATKCIVRNSKEEREAEITDKDAKLIKHTIVNLFRKDSETKDIFFMGNDEGDKVKIVNDATLLKMEKLVEAMLRKDERDIQDEKEIQDKGKQNELSKKIVDGQEKKLNEIVESLNTLSQTLDNVIINVNEEE